MFTNIYHIGQILANCPNHETVYICDLVLPVIANNLGVVQINNDVHCRNIFKNISGVQNTDYPINVLSYEKYENEIERMVKYIEALGYNVQLVYSIKDMYNSAVEISRDLRISGVISFELSNVAVSESSTFDWIPIGGKSVQLDLLTYFGMFIMTFPQACISYSAIKQMYNRYVQNIKAEGTFVNSTGYNNKLLSTVMSISELSMYIDIAVNSMRTTQGGLITTTMLRDIINSNGSSIDMTQYYNYMMYWYQIRHDVALELLQYATDVVGEVDLQRGAIDLVKIAPVVIKTSRASSVNTLRGSIL